APASVDPAELHAVTMMAARRPRACERTREVAFTAPEPRGPEAGVTRTEHKPGGLMLRLADGDRVRRGGADRHRLDAPHPDRACAGAPRLRAVPGPQARGLREEP